MSHKIDPLAIECPTCGASIGKSCGQFADPDTNHFYRAYLAPPKQVLADEETPK